LLIFIATVHVGKSPLIAASALLWVNPKYLDVSIDGAVARIYFPDSFDTDPHNRRAILYLHGNGQSHKTFLGLNALRRIKSGNALFAITSGQDYVSPPFRSHASGWGNKIYRDRYQALYTYLRSAFQIAEHVDIIGASMGGIAMGYFITEPSFPIARAYGLGSVPFLEDLFLNGGDTRKLPIRNAYNMELSGSDDFRLKEMIKDALWTERLRSRSALPDLTIYAGTGDEVFSQEFGGRRAYRRLCEIYHQARGDCTYKEFPGLTHASFQILPKILDDMEIFDADRP